MIQECKQQEIPPNIFWRIFEVKVTSSTSINDVAKIEMKFQEIDNETMELYQHFRILQCSRYKFFENRSMFEDFETKIYTSKELKVFEKHIKS